jgi:hypothetical protein
MQFGDNEWKMIEDLAKECWIDSPSFQPFKPFSPAKLLDNRMKERNLTREEALQSFREDHRKLEDHYFALQQAVDRMQVGLERGELPASGVTDASKVRPAKLKKKDKKTGEEYEDI